MNIPTFNPDNWVLMYVPSCKLLYPQSPEDVIEVANAHGDPPCLRLLSSSTEVYSVGFHDRDTLLQAYTNITNHAWYTQASRIFSVHYLGFFNRLNNWAQLKHGRRAGPDLRNTIVDLVQEFHGGSILSLEQRRSFSVRQVAQWLYPELLPGDTEEGEIQILSKLCQSLS